MDIDSVIDGRAGFLVEDGALAFAGTGVHVQTLIDHLEIGDSIEGFMMENPAVEKRQIMAFLDLARDLIAASVSSPPKAAQGRVDGAMLRNGHAPTEGDSSADKVDEHRDGLAPYVSWESRPLPDARSAPLSEIVRGLVEIIGAEGPILAYRAYTLYSRAFGLQKIQQETKERYTRALRRALEAGDIVLSDETASDDPAYRFARATGAPQIATRERGDRPIEEIPPLEIAALMHRITPDIPTIDEDGEEWLFRMVLERYELIRMTNHTKAVLQSALALAKDHPE